MSLSGKTIFISGGSRGIGKAIALRAARDGANLIIAAKTAELHPHLPGTIYTAAAEVETAGGSALPLIVDIRHEDEVEQAVMRAVERFGGIDILINNASAISLSDTPSTPLKRYDLMMDVNVRGTFLCMQACLPYLHKAANPHVLTLSPPLNLKPHWFAPHTAYTVSKYSMSLLVLGFAAEFAAAGIAVNALWPQTMIDTAALRIAASAGQVNARTPEIMADAAYEILTRKSTEVTGTFNIDETVLRQAGVTDFDRYLVSPGEAPQIDLFVDS